jgi:PAS domain S-box-containing protein
MSEKPTYEELLKKVNELEKQAGDLDQLRADLEDEKKSFEKSRARYQKLLENLNVVLYTLDLSARVVYVSPNIKSIGGYSQKEVTGRLFTDFVHPDDLSGRLEKFREILSGKEVVSEYRYLTKGGGYRWVMTNAGLFYEQGRVAGIHGMLVDITSRKKAEEERILLNQQIQRSQMMESLGRLAGGLAHEFNNLFQVLQGNIELLEMGKPLDHPDKKQLETISREIKRGAGLIRQLLLFSRGGQGQSGRQILFLNDYLKNIIDFLAQTILKRIEIRQDLDPDIPAICAEPDMLAQVLVNLGTNAADATQDGGAITIKTRKVVFDSQNLPDRNLKPGIYVLMKVSDTGSGIDEKTLSHIFEPFFTTKEIGRGTGLGLAVTYGIVRDHGGTVVCKSAVGKGTAFYVYWPADSNAGPGD